MRNSYDGYQYLHFTLHVVEEETGATVLEVQIDRPGDSPMARLNAVDSILHHEFARLFAELKTETEVRTVLLTGTGDAFCAGGDFSWFPELQDRNRLEEIRIDAKAIIYDLLDVHIPIVCAMTGHAAGLGATIALLCDTIFMSDQATVSDPHVKVGIVAGDGGTIAWPMALGPAVAKELLMTGDPVTAERAERIGLVNHATPHDQTRDTAFAFASRLAKGAPLAVQYTKVAVNAWMKAVATASFDSAAAFEIATFGTEDHQEAISALKEKRDPRFEGK